MRKVNLFKGAMLNTVMAVSLLTASPLLAANKTAKAVQLQPDHLGMMTFAQVSRLNDRMRREYVAVLRSATLDIDGFQRKFDNKTYALNDTSNFMTWLMDYADASTPGTLPVNRCLHAGNISAYPEAAFNARNCSGGECEPGRVEGQCLSIPCAIGGRSTQTTGSGANARGIRGSTCNFVASGMVNQPTRGCMNNNAVENARFARACEDRRNELARQNQSETATIVRQTNEYFGFNPGGTYRSDTCKSEGSKNLFNQLISHSYSNDAYAMLIKTAYFCQSNGQGLPDGINHYNGTSDVLKFDDLKADFDNLNKAVDDIFSGYVRHCRSPITPKDVSALRAKLPAYKRDGTIAGARKGSSFYYQEKMRLDYLTALPSGQTPTHINVLEVEECNLLKDRWTELQRIIGDIRGTYPRIADANPPPQIPPAPPTDAVKVFPTGCTEAVTREGAQLAQPVARCMPCLIQSTENLKDRASSNAEVRGQAGTYRASRKYLSLVSTMALACGDGYLHDSVLTTEMMVDYLHAFAYCKSDTYDWDANQSENEKRLALLWGDQKYWRSIDGKQDDPDHSSQFREVYGINYKDAKNIFCSEGKRGGLKGRNGYSASEKRQLLRSRRESFEHGRAKFGNGNDRDFSGALADCMSEASENAAAFNRDSKLCIGFDSFQRGETPQYTQMRETFLDDPTIVDFDNNCAIPKQMEEYHTKMTSTGSVSVCKDANSDGKDDLVGAPCSAGGAYQCLGFVDARDASSVNDKSCAPPTKPGQLVFTFSDANLPGSTSRYTYRTGSACDISSGDVRRTPQIQRSAQ